MKINKNSWHYKVVTLGGNVESNEIPKDTCSYFGFLTLILTVSLTLIGLFSFMIYSMMKENAIMTSATFALLFILCECSTGGYLTKKVYNKLIIWAKSKGICKEIDFN